jgi:Holliday junction resolvasome RuvABC DNA-binding subunit
MLFKTLRDTAVSVGATAVDARQVMDQMGDILDTAPEVKVIALQTLGYVRAVADQVGDAAKAHQRAADAAAELFAALAVLAGLVAVAILAREVKKMAHGPY